ncbi:MAG TPA: RNA 2',3'-cyclic phosphodiesterase [Terracidiphilus sp.]|jgi:2'-5' RNA ligase
MRLFVGIPLADAARRQLEAVVDGLRSSVSGLRWTAPDSWHITLQFLGNATAEQLECLKARLGEVRAEAVPVKLGELGSFDRAGVLVVDVPATRELAALERAVVAATAQCGFAAEMREFHPHITLARKAGFKRTGDRATPSGSKSFDAGLRGLMAGLRSQPRFTGFTAGEFVLFESHTEPDGARYEARLRVKLGAGAIQR